MTNSAVSLTPADSAVCTGWVQHVRRSPRRHAFRYRMGMLCVDLARATEVLAASPLWSFNRLNLACILRRDHVRGGGDDLLAAVRECVAAETGQQPEGKVLLLTQPRYFGYCFNPISLFLCFHKGSNTELQAIVAEVHNTPWGEEQIYVLPVEGDAGVWQASFAKHMHVSPFMPMDVTYHLRLAISAARMSVVLACDQGGGRPLTASMQLDRQPVTGRSLWRLIWAYPFTTLRVMAAIHWQALRIWIKRIPVYRHPTHKSGTTQGVGAGSADRTQS